MDLSAVTDRLLYLDLLFINTGAIYAIYFAQTKPDANHLAH